VPTFVTKIDISAIFVRVEIVASVVEQLLAHPGAARLAPPDPPA